MVVLVKYCQHFTESVYVPFFMLLFFIQSNKFAMIIHNHSDYQSNVIHNPLKYMYTLFSYKTDIVDVFIL